MIPEKVLNRARLLWQRLQNATLDTDQESATARKLLDAIMEDYGITEAMLSGSESKKEESGFRWIYKPAIEEIPMPYWFEVLASQMAEAFSIGCIVDKAQCLALFVAEERLDRLNLWLDHCIASIGNTFATCAKQFGAQKVKQGRMRVTVRLEKESFYCGFACGFANAAKESLLAESAQTLQDSSMSLVRHGAGASASEDSPAQDNTALAMLNVALSLLDKSKDETGAHKEASKERKIDNLAFSLGYVAGQACFRKMAQAAQIAGKERERLQS